MKFKITKNPKKLLIISAIDIIPCIPLIRTLKKPLSVPKSIKQVFVYGSVLILKVIINLTNIDSQVK